MVDRTITGVELEIGDLRSSKLVEIRSIGGVVFYVEGMMASILFFEL
jgi:hypothetical protein